VSAGPPVQGALASRIKSPYRLGATAAGMIVLGLVFAWLAATSYAAGGASSGTVKATLAAGAMLLQGLIFGWIALMKQRDVFRLHSGRCLFCGIVLGPQERGWCSACVPPGSAVLPFDATDEEIRAHALTLPRPQRRDVLRWLGSEMAVRRTDLTLQYKDFFALEPDTSTPGVVRFADAPRIPGWRVALFVGGLVAAGLAAGVGLAAAMAFTRPFWRDTGALIGGAMMAMLFLLPVPWVLWRARRTSRVRRTVTIRTDAGQVEDTLTSGKRVSRLTGPLEDLYLAVPAVAPGEGPQSVAVVLGTPRGMFMLARQTGEEAIDAYLARLPTWLPALERPDPAGLRFTRA